MSPSTLPRTASRPGGDDLVLATLAAHSDALLRVARRHSLCADDAQDALQRGLEIFLRHAGRLDPERATAWLTTVVKHEAMAVRRARTRMLGFDELDLDLHEARHMESPEERVLGQDRVARCAEALTHLKPHEAQALWLKALGNSYAEIAEGQGWSYTKVNRLMAEGRRALIRRYAEIEAGSECERWAPVLDALADGTATARQLNDARPHLRNCPSCRRRRAMLAGRRAARAA
jgi:RNA polymerase sigma factor (sigma-70 family)